MQANTGSRFIVAFATAALMSSAALAQTAKPSADSTATTVTTTTTAVTATNWLTQESAGQWRTSKMIGLTVYNDNNEKIGDIAELILNRSGKLEAVVVGAGGFLGVGERDVAVPYGQVNWVFSPVGPARTSSTSATPITTVSATSSQNNSYPDHAVLKMTKDELKAAPEFKYSH